jgi:hypothetical protein
MKLHRLAQIILAAAMFATAGCATRFSPQWSRHEIQRQTGSSPQDTFEFKLSGTTMKLAKAVVSRASDESVDFAGLSRVDLAIYALPGKRIDFTDMRFTGWDKLIQTQVGGFGLMVLVRTNGKTLNDLVVFAQGEDQFLYGRQKGRLSPDLPTTIQNTLQTAGLQGLKQHFLSATQDSENP